MTCEDCIHYEACEWFGSIFTETMADECLRFEDKSQYIVLPCKVGDTVFITEHGEIAEHKVSCIDIGFLGFGISTRCMIKCRIDEPCASAINICRTHYSQREIGEKIFMTREEAEKALKEKQ